VRATAWPAATQVLTRGHLFAGLALLLLANGFTLRIVRSIEQSGPGAALLATFQVSAVVWIAAAAAIVLLLRSTAPLGRHDPPVAAVMIAAALLPISQASWLGLTGLALYLAFTPSPAKYDARTLRRAGLILLAIAGAMFWGRLILQAGGDAVLRVDAYIVGLLTGMPTDGNLVRMAGGEGWVWIAPYCSSLTNMSVAILCCVTHMAWSDIAGDRAQALRCAAACFVVIAINDLRIAMIVWRPDHYALIHGEVGSAVTSWTTIAAVLLICLVGNRHRDTS
jgi:hypothetical protein